MDSSRGGVDHSRAWKALPVRFSNWLSEQPRAAELQLAALRMVAVFESLTNRLLTSPRARGIRHDE